MPQGPVDSGLGERNFYGTMWDCKYHTNDDQCRKRKDVCFPGGLGCVLKGNFIFPFREQEDPLVVKMRQRRKRKPE